MSNDFVHIETRRLHPLTLVYMSLKALPNALLPIIFVLYSGTKEDWTYILISLILGFFILPSVLLNYYYFDFTITDKEVIIRSGVFSKKERHIKIDRIQNISITQNFLHKILRIAKVELETAGDSKTEGVLDSVSLDVSNHIREVVRDQQNSNNTDKVDEDQSNTEHQEEIEEQDERNVIFSMDLKDTIKYGALRFRPLVLVFSAWIFSMLSQFKPNWADEFEKMIEDGYLNYINQLDIFTLALIAIAVILSILLLSWLLDILLTINTYYKFKLKMHKGKLSTSQGLFSSKQGAIPLKKLQMMVIKSNPITRRLNFYRLDMQTAGFGGGDGTKAKSETAIPFANLDQIKKIIKDIREVELPSIFTKVSKKTIRRAVVKYFIFSIPFAVALYLLIESYWILTILIPIIAFGAYIQYQYRGYSVSKNQIFVKQGFWFQKISIIPIEKIQTLHTRASYFQRRLGLASVEIDTAATIYGKDASIIDIDSIVAEEIFTELTNLFIAEKNKMKKVS